jgi:hypothetical protein
MATVAVWVAVRLGAFDLWDRVELGDGRTLRMVQTFGGVDHPFHIARAETLLRALGDGHPLRWVGQHQGGYPVEFYPLGVAWLEVGLWAFLLGALPVAAVHKLVVIAIFLLPGLAYALLPRRDGWPLGVGLVAFAVHVAVPGGSYGGGYHELVGWGLVTNVAASVALLFVLLWLTGYLAGGARSAAAGAALASAFALYSNPRSGIALGVIGVAAVLALAVAEGGDRIPLRTLVARLLLVAGVAGLLAAPELFSLLRYQDLYYFVRYESYEDLGAYLHAARVATTLPWLMLGAVGVAVGLLVPGRPLTRAAAIALVLYATMTIALSGGGDGGGPIEQLETVRLMPFQRLLTIYLAAVALAQAAYWLLPGRRWSPARDLAFLGAAAWVVVALVLGPPTTARSDEVGLFPVEGSAVASRASLEAAVAAADAAAAPGTALYVVGSTPPYWHEQLWAPLTTERPLRYDNWLWNWHTRLSAPGYDYRNGNAFSRRTVPQTFDPAFLAEHGIGGVVVTGADAKRAAAESRALVPLVSGAFDAYRVAQPTGVVSYDGGTITSVDLGDGRITATVNGGGGEVRIRENWFPRWRVTVNGERASVSRTDDGYMAVDVPIGEVNVALSYTVDGLDWLARGVTSLGTVAVAALLLPTRWRRLVSVACFKGRPARLNCSIGY